MTVVRMTKTPPAESVQDRIARLRIDLALLEMQALEAALDVAIEAADALTAITGAAPAVTAETSRLAAAIRSSVESIRGSAKGA